MRALLLLVCTACSPAAEDITASRNDPDRNDLSLDRNDLSLNPVVGGDDLSSRDLTGGGPHWVTQKTPERPDQIWAATPNDLWAVGAGHLMRSNGDGNWSVQPITDYVLGVWGSAPDNVFIVGGLGADCCFIKRTTGNGIYVDEIVPTGLGNISNVGGSDADHVWAAACTGMLRRQAGGTWIRETAGVAELCLFSVLAISSTEVWAPGVDTAFRTSGDGTWSAPLALPRNPIGSVLWGTAGDIWLTVAEEDGLYHSDGKAAFTNFSPAPPMVMKRLFAVGGTGPSNVYVGGDDGTLFHYDGVKWVQERTDLGPAPTGGIRSFFVFPSGEAYATAEPDNILHRVTN